MNAGIWFWLLYVLTLLGFAGAFANESWRGRWSSGSGFVVMVLLGLLGWGLFGSPIK